jgi:hypothetical protein
MTNIYMTDHSELNKLYAEWLRNKRKKETRIKANNSHRREK